MVSTYQTKWQAQCKHHPIPLNVENMLLTAVFWAAFVAVSWIHI